MPTLRPSRPTTEIKKDAQQLQERFSALRDILNHSHEWRKSTGKNVHRILANDPVVRDILLRNLKRDNIPLASMPPQEALFIIRTLQKQVDALSNIMNKQLQQLNPATQNQFDPTDPTHPFNQANPNNLTNQFFAVLSGVDVDQNIIDEEEIEYENNLADIQDRTPELGAEEMVTGIEAERLLARISKPSPESTRILNESEERNPGMTNRLDAALIKAYQTSGVAGFAATMTSVAKGELPGVEMAAEKIITSDRMNPFKTELTRD